MGFLSQRKDKCIKEILKNHELVEEHKYIFNFIADAKYDNDDMVLNIRGDMYLDGLGVAEDLNKAIYCYEKAIKFGNIEAMCKMRCMYLFGNKIEYDVKQTIQIFQKCVTNPSHNCHTYRHNLASIYSIGDGVPKNIDRAIELYKSALDLGNKNSAVNLAKIYEEKLETLNQ